jgi:23S rRNA (uracil1939-C5)-methyltransferase
MVFMKRRRQPSRRGARDAGGRPREGAGGGEGASLEVTVERILPGGVGLAHADGQTVLVGLAAPGDRLRVRVERARGKTLFATLVEVLAPSPDRVEPPCPYFGRCGGCDFQQLNYEAQLAAKADIIRDCLRRVGHLEPPADINVMASPAEWRYRSRARWQYDARRGALGYYERGSHRVCDVTECPVAAPAVQARLTSLRESLRDGARPEDFREFEAVEGDEGVALRPSLVPSDEGEQQRVIGGERYRFDAGCFFQINHALLAPLRGAGLGDAAGETALDLYCGVGLFTVPLARRFAHVRGVEGHPASAAYARRNLSDAGLSNATVETSAVGPWLQAHADRLPRPDFLLLDPPRTGAEPEAVNAILALRPARLSYVSCDPATLARDLHALTDGGYRLASLQAFDMFPQTHHVETVVHLVSS